MAIKNLRFTCLTLLVFGLSVCGYLFFRQFTLTANGANGFDICSAIFGTGCDATLRNPASIQLGLPLAGWGIVYYTTLIACLIIGWSLREAFEFEATLAAFGLSIIACFVSITLLVILFMKQLPFCPLCIVIHILNLTLVVLLKHMCGRPFSQLLQAFVSGVKYLLTGKGADPGQARWKLLGFVTVAFVAVVMYQWVLIEAQHRSLSANSAFDPRQALAVFESSPKQPIPLNANDPSLGLLGAPVQLVVFSDFQCPACANYSHSLTNLIKKFEGKLQVFFKHFPLGTTCNPSMEIDIHPQACEAAEAAEAANQQKKFWVFHDALFASDLNSSPNMVSLIAAEIELDLHQFEADRKSQTTIEKVKSDIELGNRLGVDATPTIFINARLVSDISLQTIEFLITHELQQADQN